MRAENWYEDMAVQKILLVDDDAEALEELKEIVELEGWEAVTAGSVDDALELLEHDPEIAVVVSDFYFAVDNSEGTNGAQFVSRAQARFAERNLAFIILSGDPSVLKTSLQVGAVRFLSKPLLVDDFVRAIKTAKVSSAMDSKITNVNRKVIAI